MRIVTNNKQRPILSYWELSSSQLKAVNKEYEGLDDIENHSFIFYKNYPYLFSDFTRVNNNVWCTMFSNRQLLQGGWHGYIGETYWNAILIKICEDNENCIIGSYYA